MTLVEHLRELRDRLAKSLLAIAVAVIAVFVFWEPVFAVLREPYCQTAQAADDCTLFAFGPFEQFAVRLRVSFLGGVVASSPVWLYQLGAFITPALHRKEKRYAASFLAASLTMFAAGVVLAYATVDRGLEFLLGIGGEGIETLPSIQSYLGFVTLTLVAFGIGFEFPVIVMFLHMVGLFPVSRMVAWRRGMYVGIFAASAVLTPSQDPFTFIAMALPLCLLYEACLLAARVRERSRRRSRDAGPDGALADDEASVVDPGPTPL